MFRSAESIALRILVPTIIALWFLVGTQTQQAHCFTPTWIVIFPHPNPCTCPGTAQVDVTITGTIDFADQQAEKFEVRLVDEDAYFDDVLGRTMIVHPPDEDKWQQGATHTFKITFEVNCTEDCYVVGEENSWESWVELALEIDRGYYSEWTNHYDTAAGYWIWFGCECPNASYIGGSSFSVDNLGVLDSYIGGTLIIIGSTVATAIFVKRAKRREEKQPAR